MTSVIQRLVKSAHCAKGESGVIHSEAPPISTVHNGQSDVIHTEARPISTVHNGQSHRGSSSQHSAQRANLTSFTQRLGQSEQHTTASHTEARPIRIAHNGQSHRGSANQNSAPRPVTQRLGQSAHCTTANLTSFTQRLGQSAHARAAKGRGRMTEGAERSLI